MRVGTTIAVVTVMLLAGSAAWAQEDRSIEEIVEGVIESCQTEIDNYCSQVTPGDGRILACFYAHQDKLSGQCEYALYDASATLEQFAAAVTYVATECAEDLPKFCGQVEMGEGSVGLCLLDHKEEVSEGCRTAMDEVGLEAVN